MAFLKLITLLSFLAFSFAMNPCRKFVCRDPADPQNADICGLIVKKSSTDWTEYVGSCKEPNKICPIHDDDAVSKRCIDNPEGLKWAGNKASDAAHCMSGKIENGICRGITKDQPCTDHYQCDIGLHCGTTGNCEPSIEEGEYCDGELILCQSYLYCREKQCIRWGSLENGVSIGRGSEDLCITRFANKHGVCDEAPFLRGKVLVESNNETCSYTNGEDNRAVCGFHEKGYGICKPGMHNLTSYWEQLVDYMNAKPQCHPQFSPLSQCDNAIHIGEGKYYKGRIAYTTLHQYTQILGVLPCMENMVSQEYFEFVHLHNRGFISYGLGILSIAAAVLAFLI